jgi:nitric oxide reductase NorD protein
LDELFLTGRITQTISHKFAFVYGAYRLFLERISIPGSTVEDSAEIAARLYFLFDDAFPGFGGKRSMPAKSTSMEKRLRILLEAGEKKKLTVGAADDREYSDEPGEQLAEEPQEDPHQKIFTYDEWDNAIKDYKIAWCSLREYIPSLGSMDFVKEALANYSPMISSIKRQFELVRPDLKKMKRQEDGEDIDLEAAVEFFVDRKMGATPSDKLYIQRLKKQRSVSIALLVDMSGSTRKVIQSSGKKIIDLEKESMVLFMEALEVLSDEYAIYGFSSRGREHVYFYTIKDFEERYTDVTRHRIGGMAPVANTRLGTALRHTAVKLGQRDRKVKLLILLSDAKPCDYDYRDRYAQEDTKIALLETEAKSINTFCITLDAEGKDFLPDLYTHDNYIVIDDINSLPEKLPAIYKRLTM